MPKTIDWSSGFQVRDTYLYLRIQTQEPLLATARELRFFPHQTGLIADAEPQESHVEPEGLDLRQRLSPLYAGPPERLNGVLVVTGDMDISAYAVNALPAPVARPERFTDSASNSPPNAAIPNAAIPNAAIPGGAPPGGAPPGGAPPGGAPPGGAPPGGILAAVLSAIFGGLLLNLMPCVFPVLSLKALHLVESADSSQLGRGLHGLAYTLGAMAFFTLLAGVLLALRSGGESFGWGFQLQSPWFVAVLAYLLFLMGLSFSGLLEFGAGLMGVGERLTRHDGLGGSFFTGALAAVVASPCTAPFMGTAVAYAISQPTAAALLVFMALGFGMALPFLAVSLTPALARALPRPGPWMDVFKRLLAFPLYLTVVWLLWVLGRQTDVSTLSAVLAGMVLLAFGAWVWSERRQATGRWRNWAAALTLVSTVAAFSILHLPFLSVPPLNVDPTVAEQQVDWEPYSASRLQELRASGQPVLLNMTADWCISCIANERVALSFPSVQQAFKDRRVALLKGDWTSRQPEITQVLHQFGREGVPLYVLYPPKLGGQPLVLPQFLTPSVVLRAFERLWDETPDDKDAVRIFDPWTGKDYILRPKGGT